MPPKSKEPSEADVIFTRASVALAKSQRLIASWLPPKTEDEIARETSKAEDEDAFETGNELLGVGATLPSNDSGNVFKRKDPSLDALRKQLLGKHASKVSATSGHRPAPASLTRPVPGRPVKHPVQDDSESDEGRAGVFASKRAPKKNGTAGKKSNQGTQAEDDAAPEGGDEVGDGLKIEVKQQAVPMKRKATSYLDEILAEKSAKKKKKKKKGKSSADAPTED